MEKWVIQGIALTISAMVIFGAINIFLNSITRDHQFYGFPLSSQETWGPCQTKNPGDCIKSTPINLAIDIAIAAALGFGGAYVLAKPAKKPQAK